MTRHCKVCGKRIILTFFNTNWKDVIGNNKEVLCSTCTDWDWGVNSKLTAKEIQDAVGVTCLDKETVDKLLKKGYKAGDILRALKHELKMRDSNGDMKWMKSMKNWLSEECFAPYLEDLKSDNRTDNTVDYGGKVL